jgi:hypothetical protein
MIDLNSLSGDELYNLGQAMGRIADSRPDIVHRLMIGVRDGLEDSTARPATTISGDTFWRLWRQWYHVVKDGDMMAHPPILFLSLSQPSGTGKVKR